MIQVHTDPLRCLGALRTSQCDHSPSAAWFLLPLAARPMQRALEWVEGSIQTSPPMGPSPQTTVEERPSKTTNQIQSRTETHRLTGYFHDVLFIWIIVGERLALNKSSNVPCCCHQALLQMPAPIHHAWWGYQGLHSIKGQGRDGQELFHRGVTWQETGSHVRQISIVPSEFITKNKFTDKIIKKFEMATTEQQTPTTTQAVHLQGWSCLLSHWFTQYVAAVPAPYPLQKPPAPTSTGASSAVGPQERVP